MPNYQNYRGLLAAILIQAVRDQQSGKHRQDAEAFIKSDAFSWAWAELTDDTIGMPATHTAKSLITGDQIVLHRGAYHSALKGGDTRCDSIFSRKHLH